MIFYFSGTGNSRRVACDLGALLHEEVRPLTDVSAAPAATGGFGIVFPVYGWHVPAIVEEFLRALPHGEGQVWTVMTCGDDVGLADRLLARLLASRGRTLTAVFSVAMRNTYTALPGFDVDADAVEQQKESLYEPRIQEIAQTLRARIYNKEWEGKYWDDVRHGAAAWAKTYLLGGFFCRFLTAPSRWHVRKEACTACGACQKACPLQNIQPDAHGRPIWSTHCTACFACYHICPHHAIENGRWTRGKGQVRQR